ncbi:hypothetical protein Dimus_006202, partial [Dionaea muscipula]
LQNKKDFTVGTSTVGTSNHIWKPRSRKRGTTWQRVPVNTTKANSPTKGGTGLDPTPLATLAEMDSEVPLISIPRDSSLIDLPTSSCCSLEDMSSSRQDMSNLMQDPNCSNILGMDQQ